MVLEKILESPLYNKEIKPVNLKGSQPLTPAVLAEASTEGFKVETMDASTAKLPNHGSSKQIFCSSTSGGSSERLKSICTLGTRYMHCILPSSTGGQERGVLSPGGRKWIRHPQRLSLAKWDWK